MNTQTSIHTATAQSGQTPISSKPIHGAPKPVNVPSDMQEHPPVPCDFKVGDRVTGINDQGVVFPGRIIRGFTKEVTSWGAFIYEIRADGKTDGSAWWFPGKPENFRHELEPVTA